MNLKNKSILIVDTGLATHMAQVMARSFGKVFYFIPDSDAYPETDRDEIGCGIPSVERVHDIYEHIHVDPAERDVDLFFFTDTGFSGLQNLLLEMGYNVAGSLYSDLMELDKDKFYRTLAKIGLPVAPTTKIVGVANLRKHLQKHTEVVVKISKHRGLTETRKVCDYGDAEPWLDDMEANLGMKKDDQIFLVQEMIESECETGMDSLCLDGQHPDNSMMGIEAKDAGYFGCVVKKYPAIIQDINDKMAPIYKKLGYQGMHSNELRITKDGVAYSIDETCRMPSPPGELFFEMYEDNNFAQAIWDLGEGTMPTLKPKAKYGAEIILTSEWYGKGHWLKVSFPKEIEQFVKLKNFCIRDGEYWVIPNDNDGYIGAVVAIGDDPDKVMALCLEYAEQVKGYKVVYSHDVFCDIKESCEAAAKHGIKIL
jgi:hypothetical protein